MRAGRTSGITSQCNRFTGLYQLVYINQLLGQMPIDRFQTVIMTDNDIFTISATALILNDTYLTVKRGTDCIAYIYFNIQTVMRSSSARAITEYIGNTGMFGRHAKAFQIKSITFRHDSIAISLHKFIVPARIQIQPRIQRLFRTDLFLQSQ